MYRNFFKRFIDILLSLIALPFVLILIVIFAPIIYFTDKGPVFYNATRVGKDYKPFKMFKFRSMYVNAPDIRNSDGSTFNSESDPRVTSIGKFMRKTSIDEIPQLLNVLIGDMSFVGPRPTVYNPDKDLKKESEYFIKRLNVRPGITGYAQALYRNSISQEEKFKNDAYYVDNVSFTLDVKIIWKTAMSVLMRDNINAN